MVRSINKPSCTLHIILYTIGATDISQCLIPDYVNSPSTPEDAEEELFGTSTHWGKQYYIDHFPVLDRTKSDEYIS